MEQGLESHHARFATIRAGLGREVDHGIKLIEELLAELNSTKTLLNQTKLDLDSEREGRRRLQEQISEDEQLKKIQKRRPFIVLIIDADADGYVFHDRFITRGFKGGEDAADALQAELRRYTREIVPELSRVDVIVKAFANIGGLGGALERNGMLGDKNQLRAFAAGFSGRQALFDFVDVGAGKERADHKVRESVHFFLESFQCKHILLGCCHDAGYAPFLGQFVGDRQVAARITLVKGTPLPEPMRALGFKTTELNAMFNTYTHPPAPPQAAGPVARPMATGVVSGRRSLIGAPPAIVASTTSPVGDASLWPYVGRLGPVLTDQTGRRVDRPLQINEGILERMRKGDLCYYLFLRGECVSTKCARNHAHRPITDDEFDALWMLARQGQCYADRKARVCEDPMCIYGHKAADQNGATAGRDQG